MLSMAWVICRLPRDCSWLERSTCCEMVRIFSPLFMISSEPRACWAVAAAICCTVALAAELEVKSLSFAYGPRTVVDGVSFRLEHGKSGSPRLYLRRSPEPH